MDYEAEYIYHGEPLARFRLKGSAARSDSEATAVFHQIGKRRTQRQAFLPGMPGAELILELQRAAQEEGAMLLPIGENSGLASVG